MPAAHEGPGIICALVRESVSAALDGEANVLAEASVQCHLLLCESCREFADRARELGEFLRLRALEVTPDLSGAVLGQLGLAPAPALARRDRQRRKRLPILGRWAAALVPLVFACSALGTGAFQLVASRPAPPRTPCTFELARVRASPLPVMPTPHPSGRFLR